jgi:hypothetical protein
MAVLAENRARLTLAPGGASNRSSRNQFYFNGPASPLRQHNGILFPYQPDITYSQSVNYSPYDMTHTNYTFNAYRNTPSPTIQMTVQFASITQEEGEYTLGALHFLRSVSKMFFGLDDLGRNPSSGTPPPVLRFSAFGEQQFNNIPVVLESFSTTYDSGVDLIDINGTQVPTLMNFFIGMSIQINPDRQKSVYSTHNFINGSGYKQGFI